MLDVDFEKFASFGKKEPFAPSEERAAVRQSDLELWHHWNNNGRQPEHLRPLLNNFRGMIRKEVNRFTGNVEVPPAAIHQEYKEQFVRAMQTYNPDKGAALGSWVVTNLRKGQRWVNDRQNTARVASTRTGKIGDFNNAFAHLKDQFGREPSTIELSDHLLWPEAEVKRMQSELRKSNIASAWAVDPIDIMPSKEKEWMMFVRYELTPEEMLVYDYTIGHGGKPQLRPSEIAKTLSMSPSKVTRIRQKIADKISRFEK